MWPVLTGIIAALATLVAFGFVSLGFYASVGGLLIATAVSSLVGLFAGAFVFGISNRPPPH